MTTTENTTRPSNNTITRRKMLQSVAAASAATFVPATALAAGHVSASLVGDGASVFTVEPLLRAIQDWHAGSAAYNSLPDNIIELPGDPATEWTYGPPLLVLSDWTSRAETMKGALEALKLVGEEVQFLSVMGETMFNAALGYLEAHA